MSRVLGLDHGSRRIGVALGDTETGLAFSRPAIVAKGRTAAVAAVVALAHTEGADQVVLGLPLTLAGDEGPQAGVVRGFGERLAAAGLEVAYADERLTSWEAGERLAGQRRPGARRPTRRSGELDSAAAQLILQQYLDASRGPA
ncbi:MAG TPA: Holliday junction resolvase RuvX [Candidatus Limnocylindria bacterium]|nr:Holliday junction resolvase RuvX [Candidatus Limnocylindria bacterium]